MLPRDNHYGGWPRSGEIDMMESKGIKQPHIFLKIFNNIRQHLRSKRNFHIFFSVLYIEKFHGIKGKERIYIYLRLVHLRKLLETTFCGFLTLQEI